MLLERSETPEALIIHVQDTRIDAACAIEFKEAMRSATASLDRRIILDLTSVGFIDSSGLGAVVAVRKMLGPDHPLELACLSPAVEKVFRLTRMDSIFTILASVPEAQRNAV